MRTRVITGITLILIFFPILIIGGLPFELLIYLGLLLIGVEIDSIFRNKWPRYLRGIVYALPIASFYLLTRLAFPLLTTFLVLMILYIVLNIIEYRFDFDDMTFVFYINIFILTAFSTIYSLRLLDHGLELVLFVVLITFGTDTFAYFTGMYFGKHKLNERVSSKKTIEGSIGGSLIGSLIGFSYLFFSTGGNFPLLELIVLSLVISIIGQFGDLAFSSIKRHYNLKDFGNLLPGHGGVLDRIDSLMLNLIIMFILSPYLIGVIL